MRALVVDDSAAMRRLLAELVGESGYDVEALGSGEEALDSHTRLPADLLVVDWTLPGLSGLDLCRTLRALPGGDAPTVVVVTARSQPEDIHAVLDAGADDFVLKPIEADRFRARLLIASRRPSSTARATTALGPLASCADAVLLLRAEQVVDANTAAAIGLGHASERSLVGSSWVTLTHPDDRAALLIPGGPRRVRLRRRDGSLACFDTTTAFDPRSGTAIVVARVAPSPDREVRALVESRLGCVSLLSRGLACALGEPLARLRDGLTEAPDAALADALALVDTLGLLADDDPTRRVTPGPVLKACAQVMRAAFRHRARVDVALAPLPELALSSARFAQIVLGVAEVLLDPLEDVTPVTVRLDAGTDAEGHVAIVWQLLGERHSTRAERLVHPTTSGSAMAVVRTLAVHAGGSLAVEVADALVIEVRLPPARG